MNSQSKYFLEFFVVVVVVLCSYPLVIIKMIHTSFPGRVWPGNETRTNY